jgi:tRNA (adenine-N(1)-)-methyltransferase non-catalytic subunit
VSASYFTCSKSSESKLTASSTISLGKYGSFQSNLIIDRPYNLTYELQDKKEGQLPELRIVPASELHAETIAEEDEGEAENPSKDVKITIGGGGVEFELVGENGEVIMRSNRETIDDSARQTLTMEEIEELKKHGTDSGKDLIAKLMLSHTALDQKTAFSLAKYKLLKTKKYLRQFTVLPLDVAMLTHWLIEEKDAARIMEMRQEMIALLGCWGNVHFSGDAGLPGVPETPGNGRWLVVDEVGGLLVAAMAERMGVLQPDGPAESRPASDIKPQTNNIQAHLPEDLSSFYANSNTLTMVHTNAQPNLSLLKYFNYNADVPQPDHPLTRHLKTISWLQLLAPEEDTAYCLAPPSATLEELASWKSGKRGTYYRKRRRYTRIRSIVDETRAGSFDGLVIASSMDPIGILRELVPLLRGGAPIAIYSPTIEPLTTLADCYSMGRRTAFITAPPSDGDLTLWQGNDDYPLNPTLLLGATVQTSKVREWQVLPGRTHPFMTSRGGAEGYVFTATRVMPVEGKIEARGNYKRRKAAMDTGSGVANTPVESAGSADAVLTPAMTPISSS